MARISVDIDGEFLEDIRAAFGAETDEAAVLAAVVDAAKRLRRQEFSDAIKTGEIDLMYDVRNDPRQESSAA
ncbi:type II toxin-antitoxin system VapB family antitoxin [Streptomyces sp. NPDC051569]|uniref:type II toxin-antitoxin system VapB family antitoxin n=1 Tax=Streptomyces sp. NPDC051569 TaxID=3365661 RepID=UPI003798F363